MDPLVDYTLCYAHQTLLKLMPYRDHSDYIIGDMGGGGGGGRITWEAKKEFAAQVLIGLTTPAMLLQLLSTRSSI